MAYHYIRNFSHPIIAHVFGCAMSGASLILLACPQRRIRRHSFVLIHQLRTGFWGRFDEFQDEQINKELLMDQLRQIYKAHTTMKEQAIADLLKRDLYIHADDALQYGFAYQIED